MEPKLRDVPLSVFGVVVSLEIVKLFSTLVQNILSSGIISLCNIKLRKLNFRLEPYEFLLS